MLICVFKKEYNVKLNNKYLICVFGLITSNILFDIKTKSFEVLVAQTLASDILVGFWLYCESPM